MIGPGPHKDLAPHTVSVLSKKACTHNRLAERSVRSSEEH